MPVLNSSSYSISHRPVLKTSNPLDLMDRKRKEGGLIGFGWEGGGGWFQELPASMAQEREGVKRGWGGDHLPGHQEGRKPWRQPGHGGG